MAARDNNLGATNAILDRDHISAESITDIVILNHHAFALWHDRFKFSEIENHIGTVEAPDRAADDLAGAILEFLVNHLLLDLTDALHHRLFGSLRGDAAEITRGHFHFDGVAHLCVRLDLKRLGKLDLVLWIADMINHYQISQRANFSGFRIDVDAKIARRADALFRGREQRIRNRLEQDFALDPALPLKVIQHGNKLRVHKNI